jgi:hypothetical protein
MPIAQRILVNRKSSAGRRRPWVAPLVLIALAALLRLGLVNRHGLWADELFSLAMATGHSLEHPAAQADPALGDYVEAPQPLPPSAYSRYLEHDNPPAGPGRVIRAVFLSDTNPPLYYLLLYGWTRALGTGDTGLRLFTVVWALACLPVIWSLARWVGGRTAAVPACLLFAFAPFCVFYSTEGRPYSLLWFLTVSTMWLTLKLQRGGWHAGLFLLWVAVGACGLLTHYFYAFVWASGLWWLFLYPGQFSRKCLSAGAFLTALCVLPWYIHVAEILAAWRVTGYWLNYPPPKYVPVISQLRLPWSFLSLRIVGHMLPIWADCLNLALFLALAAAIWRRLSWSLFRPRPRLLWFWLLGACLGPLVFDLLRGSYVMTFPRYASAGMPALFLLLALGLGRLRFSVRAAFLMLITGAFLAGIGRIYLNNARSSDATRQVAQFLAEQAGTSDVVIVHSIPSTVAGIARYMESARSEKSPGFASWVGQLKQRRVPEDLQSLASGRRRIILVKINEVGEPAPEETWLRGNATPAGEYRLEEATVLYFVPRGTDTFFTLETGIGPLSVSGKAAPTRE